MVVYTLFKKQGSETLGKESKGIATQPGYTKKVRKRHSITPSDHYSSVFAAGWIQEGRNYQQLHHRRVEPDHRGDGNQEVESCSCLFLGGTSVKACTAAAGEEEWAQAERVPRDVLTQITVAG